MKFNFLIAEDVALAEVKAFVEEFAIAEVTDKEVKEAYPQVILAVRLGLLTFENKIPLYKLSDPIKNDEGAVSFAEFKLKTRVSMLELKDLQKDLNPQKDRIDFTLRTVGFVIGQPAVLVNKLSKFDLAVVEQLTTLFL